MPILGMYSGIRLSEICQLHVEDDKKVDGVLCFDVNDEKDKKLKTKSSRRIVPVHPVLTKLGLEQYIEKIKGDGAPRLWMNLSNGRDEYGHVFGKRFQRFNRKLLPKTRLNISFYSTLLCRYT